MMQTDDYHRSNHKWEAINIAVSITPPRFLRRQVYQQERDRGGAFSMLSAAKIDKLHLGQYFDGSGIFFSHFSQIILLCSPYILSFLYSKIHLHNIHILLFPDVFENQYTEFYNKDI